MASASEVRRKTLSVKFDEGICPHGRSCCGKTMAEHLKRLYIFNMVGEGTPRLTHVKTLQTLIKNQPPAPPGIQGAEAPPPFLECITGPSATLDGQRFGMAFVRTSTSSLPRLMRRTTASTASLTSLSLGLRTRCCYSLRPQTWST